jgi:hypothetical protein
MNRLPSIDQLQDFIIRTQRYISMLARRTRDAERELKLARELLAEKRRATRAGGGNGGRRSLSANLGQLGTRRPR